jgi:hypothetical protein
MKQYIGIIRDHSGSMGWLRYKALQDFNSQLEINQKETAARDIDALVTVVEVGAGRTDGKEFQLKEIMTTIERIKPLRDYPTPGGSTPLFDGLNKLIDVLETAPDKDLPGTAFLVLVITDGDENVSMHIGKRLGERIRELQKSDRWTFTFRVPRGGKHQLIGLGIPAGNILEWEQSEEGFRVATVSSVNATQSYYGARSMGRTSVDSFYADAVKITPTQLKRKLTDITGEVDVLRVRAGGEMIAPFVERATGKRYLTGAAFYQLTKPEPKVQSNKLFVIRNKKDGKLYGGQEARDLLGLPQVGTVKLSPGDHGDYDIFVQSTSVNRKLVAGTEVVYWPGVRR